ncbi:hypothetical protein F9Z84_06690 [Escherichia coli]|nr:hypothetical protein F9Z84_06690 [Escherichia coli]
MMNAVRLIPVLQATTEKYFVESTKLIPQTYGWGDHDPFDRGKHQTSALKVGEEIPFELLCKLHCNQWTDNDYVDMNNLSLGSLIFQATNIHGESQILTLGSLYGIARTEAKIPFRSDIQCRNVDFELKHFSLKLFKDVRAVPVTVFGDLNTSEQLTASIGFQCRYDASTKMLTSKQKFDCRVIVPNIDLSIIGFTLDAYHASTSIRR